MRLIYDTSNKENTPSRAFVLVRHGVDVPVLTQELDQPLVEEFKLDIRVLGQQILRFCESIGVSRVVIRHSSRLRAFQTAEILADELCSERLPVNLVEAAGFREIYQGDFMIKSYVAGKEYKPLVDAWNAWQKKLNACELNYRFGNPLIDGSGNAEFPELIGWFNKFGEHQGDFSLRLYCALKKVFEDTSGALQVVVGHQASCSRVQRIISATQELSGADDFVPGDFVKFLEKKGSRVTLDSACGVVVSKPKQNLISAILEKEIAYLESII